VIMDFGRIVAEGSPAELTARYRQPHLEAVFLHLTGHGLDGDARARIEAVGGPS
jgi:hypothetical protein